MFVRFKQTANSLQASLVDTSRIDGKVRHEHVASLGSIAMPPSIADRITFWRKLHDRLAKLANRITAEQQAKVLSAIHAKVPMVIPDDQRTLQLENATADGSFWTRMADMQAETIEGYKALAASVADSIAKAEAAHEDSVAHAAQAKDRIERIERGEVVEGGVHQPITVEEMTKRLIERGVITKSDIDRCVQTATIGDLGLFEDLLTETHKRRELSEKAAHRAVWRRAQAVLADRPEREP